MGEQPTEEVWNARYDERVQLWSGEPNVSLVRETATLTPGTALDLGCGEGADAVWLASRGWRVLGVDVSSVALDRAREASVRAGAGDSRIADPQAVDPTVADLSVGGGVRWAQVDLAHAFPDGSFDLVSAHYVHTHEDLDVIELEYQAANAVSLGGTLLFVVHTGPPELESGHGAADGQEHHHRRGSANAPRDLRFPTVDELLAIVDEQPGRWEVRTAEVFERKQTAADGTSTTRSDLAVRLQRMA